MEFETDNKKNKSKTVRNIGSVGRETWKMNKVDDKMLMLRILKISWKHHINKEKVRKRADMEPTSFPGGTKLIWIH